MIAGIESYNRAAWESVLEDSGLTLWDFILEANIDDAWCDVEGEMNGLLTYDRAILKVDGERIRKLNSLLRQEDGE